MSEVPVTYSCDRDVNMRLDLGSHFKSNLDFIINNRERAHRWIRHEYTRHGKVAPGVEDELDDTDVILKDIEADRAAYYYLRDKMEWASEPSSKMLQLNRWKDESEEMLNSLFRTKWGDELYAFKDFE